MEAFDGLVVREVVEAVSTLDLVAEAGVCGTTPPVSAPYLLERAWNDCAFDVVFARLTSVFYNKAWRQAVEPSGR